MEEGGVMEDMEETEVMVEFSTLKPRNLSY